ncbi:hypothetical protein KDH_29400 [Dictyobacter sp. S3.2.2.5]|uniref:GlsB/YeaQ/YmgE family stress response membrane protein n=2 Tax=Dictyobacter halimunensis TaxID=3026934 RepID=A0ABQ6FUE7_9CHLR|nr:hypothetical protein KDH_29400 [Dictyobacter sp. S3.2.2.5]
MIFASTSLWGMIGLGVGMLSIAARLQPKGWSKWPWFGMLAIGGCTGWAGGWVGVWLFGHLFAPVTALWIAIVGTIFIPRCIAVVWRSSVAKVTTDRQFW